MAGGRWATIRWRLIAEPGGRPGWHNMAVDEALLRDAREGLAVLRWYRWAPACLSFGRNEPAGTRYDRARIAALGLDTVRRPTGGRAVWHETEVTYAVAGPADLFGSLPDTYRAIHEVIAQGLRSIGAPVALAAGTRALLPDAGACFASPAGGEIVAGGRKLVGSAQVREGGAFLQHGSILLADAQDVVARITLGEPPPSHATSLGEVLGRDVTFAEVTDAITAAARAAWSGSWERRPAPADVAAGRFADPAWTWHR